MNSLSFFSFPCSDQTDNLRVTLPQYSIIITGSTEPFYQSLGIPEPLQPLLCKIPCTLFLGKRFLKRRSICNRQRTKTKSALHLYHFFYNLPRYHFMLYVCGTPVFYNFNTPHFLIIS